MSGTTPYIVYLPEVALEEIFSYLSYDEIAKNRIVCKKFDEVGRKLLSRGFVQVERRHSAIFKKVKSMLPRRESERKVHPLARYCDVLSALETRISMLNMTFMKYIDNDLCCFIPGKVLDEIERLLTLVQNNKNPLPRSHELLQEMRDISSMAMEHFEEHILPKLRAHLEAKTVCSYTTSTKTSKVFLVQQNSITDNMRVDIRKVKKQSKTNKQHVVMLSQQIRKIFKKMKHQNMRIKMQNTKIREQERKIHDQALKIQELESFFADLKKHVEERDQKSSEISEHEKSAMGSPPKFFKTNIRPRVAHILPVYGPMHFELERKRKSGSIDEVPSKLSRETKEQINDKINESITSNISKNISDQFEENEGKRMADVATFIKSSIESYFLKAPISGIKPRKRKMSEDIDLK